MYIIKVKDLTKSNLCIYTGERELNNLLRVHLQKGEKVVLDFEGIDKGVTVFFGKSIGTLYGEFDYDLVDSLIEVINAKDHIRFMIDKARNYAKKYYKNPEYYRKLERELIESL